ncbi:alpha amylase C-terminal domain-containing protein [Flocculibacter collagenilyticus]|uniref:alpha amylase C-terminal domain-containing protein n=1 Tax=Flocculibacter collagenilyticus TaxID=2744479 RepID=UPI0018F70A6F|nr:alpha amylase C-terminal domain-containing protein [Flocculibacter collagenilyticus]
MIVDQYEDDILAEPFKYLGKVVVSNQLMIRVLAPDATKVVIKELATNQVLGEMRQVSTFGLYELILKPEQHDTHYLLEATTEEDTKQIVDAYQFQQEAIEAEHCLTLNPTNLYHQVGAQLIELKLQNYTVVGTRFAVYAPNASSVSVIGSFNNWDERLNPMHRTECGHWVLFIPKVSAGESYRFKLKDGLKNELPPKLDPIGFDVMLIPATNIEKNAEQSDKQMVSVVVDHQNYQWLDHAWIANKQTESDLLEKPTSVFELDLVSCRSSHINTNKSQNIIEAYKALIPKIKSLGFSHVQLPVHELFNVDNFSSSQRVGSQIYNPFSPNIEYGTPEDLKAFIDQCHQNDIGVIAVCDFSTIDTHPQGLIRFDGTHLYECEQSNHSSEISPFEYEINIQHSYVQQMAIANALFWIEHYHVDGIKLQNMAGLLSTISSKNIQCANVLKTLSDLVHEKYSSAFILCDDFTHNVNSNQTITAPVLGFDCVYYNKWTDITLRYVALDSRYRKYQHTDITETMILGFDERFFISLASDNDLLQFLPGTIKQRQANYRCLVGFMFAHSGKKHLKFFYDRMVNTPNEYLMYKDLNRLYRTLPELYELDGNSYGFTWLEHHDAENSIVAFIRKDKSGNECYVVSNFSTTCYSSYRLGVNAKGKYKIIFNSDDATYGGVSTIKSQVRTGSIIASNKACQGREYSIEIELPALTTIFLKIEI